MKKIFGLILAICSISIGFTSCLDDAKTKASCTYYVVADSIVYSDSLDAQYDSLIRVSLLSLGHSFYTFTKEAEVEQSMTSYAVAECDNQAIKQFDTNIKKTVTLSDIQNEMYKAKSDYFNAHGIPNASAIALSPFTVYLSLWNYSYNVQLGWNTIDVSL